ncbi:MAG TPA: hypothetical protein VJ835_11565 [Fimbriimonadaceae bacterium]|nr:hypothetical protein [Fimbriimonadaceae bacterium]
METPPTYNPPKKSNTGLIIGLVLGGIAICCIGGVALLFFGGLQIFKQVAPMAECMMNYGAVQEALTDYADANKGNLPSAAAWQDELAPFVEKRLAKLKKDSGPFKVMESNGEWGCSSGDRKTGMAFNSKVTGKTYADARKDDEVLIFEVDQTGRNLSQPFVEQPKSTSPKIMGEHRGWITIRAAGGLEMGDKEVGRKFKFETNN